MARHRYCNWSDSTRPTYEVWLHDILDYLQGEEARVVRQRLAELRQAREEEVPLPAEAYTPIPRPVYSVVGDKLVVRLAWPDGSITHGYDSKER